MTTGINIKSKFVKDISFISGIIAYFGYIKIAISLFLLTVLAFSANSDQNQSNAQELKWDKSNKSKTSFVSKKEASYQKYRKNLEEENKKLEADGFCSCNNN